jgi:hypothetical protein
VFRVQKKFVCRVQREFVFRVQNEYPEGEPRNQDKAFNAGPDGGDCWYKLEGGDNTNEGGFHESFTQQTYLTQCIN